MKNISSVAKNSIPGQFAVLLLASAFVFPAFAQQSQPCQPAPKHPSPGRSSPPSTAPAANTDKEGFWGHLQPFARKKWVHKRTDPINDR